MDNIKLEFEDDALKEIVRETMTRKTGARGLRSVMERVLQQAMFTMPGSGEKKMTLTTEMVKESLYTKPTSGGGVAKNKTNIA